MLTVFCNNMPRAQKRRYQNENEKREKFNSTISLSIAEVIRFSTDDQFRSKCFQLMKVSNTNDFQQSIKKKLDSLTSLQKNGTDSPILPKKSTFQNISKEAESFEDQDSPQPGPSCVGLITHGDNGEETDRNAKDTVIYSFASSQTNLPAYTEDLNTHNTSNTLMKGYSKERCILSVAKSTNTSIGTEKQLNQEMKESKNVLVRDDTVGEKMTKCEEEDFWPTEQCCLWNTNLLQEEMNDFHLNDKDTDWL